MRPVAVRILHPEPAPDAGPSSAGSPTRERASPSAIGVGFGKPASTDVRIVSGTARRYAVRARGSATWSRADRPAGLVVLGSGAIPLATAADRRAFVAAAARDDRRALANNRYSADIVAIARAGETLADVPDLAGDNALPRWLDEVAGYAVGDLRRRWRLAVDIDGPLDVVLTGGGLGRAPLRRRSTSVPSRSALAAVRRIAGDPSAELLVAGRTSAATVAMAGAADGIADAGPHRGAWPADARRRASGRLHPCSAPLLERDGPDSLGRASRPPRRRGARRHPGPAGPSARRRRGGLAGPEDRFASDLLLADRDRATRGCGP